MPFLGEMDPATQVLYDGEVRCRGDIDAMEDAIRNVRMTALDKQQRITTRRCNILETAAYMSVRFSLLRWISTLGDPSPPVEEGGTTTSSGGVTSPEEERITCGIGNGIVLRCRKTAGSPPQAKIVLMHSDNDGTLPIAAPPPSTKGKRGKCEDDDEPRGYKKGRRSPTG